MKLIISGTSRGIGKAIALKFLKEGFNVYGFDLKESTIDDPNYHHYQMDIRCKELPQLDAEILINNAGTLEENEALDINLKGTINFSEHFKNCPSLKSVLFIASASARNGAEFPYYCASKGGVVSYMKNLAMTLANRKITVNSISPGGVITESNNHILNSDKLYKEVLEETLFYKWAKPEEIAEFAYFFTVFNQSMTGEDILVDNGEILKSNFIW